nr:phosphatase PAP2 family protein [Kofleriaceae bacterium]
MRWIAAIVVVTALGATTSIARADRDRHQPAYKVRLDRDLAAIAIAGTTTIGWFIDLGPAYCAPQCDPSRLDAIDKPFAGRWEPGWSTAGTITAAGILLSAPIALFIAETPGHALTDTIVVGQSVAFAAALAIVFETGVRRPRPFMYGDKAPLSEREDTNGSLSFYSGHTTLSFSASVALVDTLCRLHVATKWRALAMVGVGAAAFVAASRVLAGDHFPTDVTAGALTGAGFGVLVPALHDRGVTVAPMAAADGTFQLAALGTF